MEKIKNILRPGHHQDDQAMYGTDNKPQSTADYEKPDDTILQTDPDGAGSKSHNHGILRQILNPGGEKYDEQAYGTTAHVVDPTAPVPEREQGLLHTDEGAQEKSHGILRQILNPGGDKYDEQRFGTTAHADGPLNIPTSGTETNVTTNAPQIDSTDAADDKQSTGVLRQLLNPGGEKYSELRYGETGTVVPGSEPNPRAPSDAFVPAGELVDRSSSVAHPATSSTEPNTSMVNPAQSSNLAGEGPSYYGTTGSSVNPTSSTIDSTGAYGGAIAANVDQTSAYVDSNASSYGGNATTRTLFPTNNDQFNAPGASSVDDDIARQTSLARDAAAAPGGIKSAGTLAQNNQTDVADATFTERSQRVGGSTSGPHITDTANRLDPAV